MKLYAVAIFFASLGVAHAADNSAVETIAKMQAFHRHYVECPSYPLSWDAAFIASATQMMKMKGLSLEDIDSLADEQDVILTRYRDTAGWDNFCKAYRAIFKSNAVLHGIKDD